MLTLATGTLTAKPRPRPNLHGHQKGFTFLEILAVVVIIGITITFASLSLGSRAGEDRLANEAERLQALLVLAADEAIVQGEEIGLLLAKDGYAFYHLKENKWVAYEEGPLRERELPEGMTLYLSNEGLEDFKIPLPEDQGKNPEDGATGPSPQILMLSSGELTPFILQLHSTGLKAFYQAEGKLTGQIEMTRLAGDI